MFLLSKNLTTGQSCLQIQKETFRVATTIAKTIQKFNSLRNTQNILVLPKILEDTFLNGL